MKTKHPFFVIPAKAGIHSYIAHTGLFVMDTGFRRYDAVEWKNKIKSGLLALEHFRKSGNRFSDKKCGNNKQVERGFDSIKTGNALVFALALMCNFLPIDAAAAKIRNPVAVFSALDKVTARITTLVSPVNQPVRFGALVVTAKVCYTRPLTEKPKTTAFVIVDEHQLNGQVKRLFTGWMFAANPGLHGVEHPVYDVWLKTCKASAPVKPATGALRKSP